jgi:hypothetical protein
VLARQLLLERARLPIPRALDAVAGIQAQYAPSMYVGLWSRLEGFRREDLTRALEARTVVQASLMRLTIHLVSRGDYWPAALGTRQARRSLWLRYQPGGRPDEEDMEEAARIAAPRLAEGPLQRKELQELVGSSRTAQGLSGWIEIVRAPPSGTWERRRADLYAAADTWLGPPPGDLTAEQGIELLVRRYLRAFGPATPADVASWAGLPAKVLAPVLGAMKLRRFRTEDGHALVDVPRAPLPDPGTPAPPRFLPTWDATLLVHCRRAGILAEEDRARIFNTKNPHSESTFLVDGAVRGTWRHAGGRIEIEPFGRLDAATRRALEDEAGRLAVLHA